MSECLLQVRAVTRAQVLEALPAFRGNITQVPLKALTLTTLTLTLALTLPGTKLLQQVLSGPKGYIAVGRIGQAYDTLDVSGG